MGSRAPYRVVVWGPGHLGQETLRELLRREEFEVVGCLAYSQGKAGLDVGELVGLAPTGVAVTTDAQAVLDAKPDVVVYTGRFQKDTRPQDEEVARILRAGIDVVAATSYHFPWQRGADHARLLEDACREGGATLLGTGIHPGWCIERVVPLMTSLCTSVDRVDIAETVDLSNHSGDAIRGMGFGLPPERLGRRTRKWIFSRYYFDSLAYLAHVLGVELERITSDLRYRVAERLVHAAGVTIEPGTVASLDGTFTGWVGGEPHLVLRERLYLDPSHVEDTEITSPDFYDVHISGRPLAVRTRVDITVTDPEDVYGADVQCGAQLGTAVQLVLTIPAVVAAPPGIMLPELFAHAATDLRAVVDRGAHPPAPVPEEIL